jgi:predicted RNA binding protein YcfA (HicA-like mRNA interferase family)
MTRKLTRQDLPLAPGERHVKAFARASWAEVRRTGSHAILEKDGERYHLAIPCHGSTDVKRGLLAAQVHLAGMTIEEYCECFKGKRLEKVRAVAATRVAAEDAEDQPA